MMKMKKIIFLLIASVCFNSCALYKMYDRPEVKTDGLFRETVQNTDTSSLGNINWKEIFTDTKLQTLIEQGLSNNTDLKIAYLKVTEAEASLKSARLAYIPSVSFAPQGTISSFDNAKASKTYQLAASASWELDVFGKLTNAKRSAKAVYEQSSAYRQAVQTQLIATIANSYYSLLMLDSQLAISQQSLNNWKENLKMMRAMKEAGLTNEAAVSQTAANCLTVENSTFTLKKNINELENTLSTLLGDVPQAIERGKLDNQSFTTKLSVGVPLQILGNRPDVRQAEYALAQSFYAVNEARASFYPNITLSGSGGWTNSAGYIANPSKLLLTAIGSLTQPIFNKGQIRARYKIAKSQQEQATLTFQQTLLNAGAEVNNSLTQWQTARKRIELDKQQIKSLQTAVKSTQLLMQHGTTTYLEVLTAQESLLQAELTHITDRFDEIQGVINLYHALGGGR